MAGGNQYFADRGLITAAGIVLDGYQVTNISWDVDYGTDFVDTMSEDYTVAGFVRKNLKVSGSFNLAIPTSGNMPTLELLDFQTNNYTIMVQSVSAVFGTSNNFGGMSWIFGGMAVERVSGGFSGPGTPGQIAYAFKARTYDPIVAPQG